MSEMVSHTGVDFCKLTGVARCDLNGSKFQLLLPTIYPLNKSRSKNVICGLKVNGDNREVTVMIGIMDRRASGVLFEKEVFNTLIGEFGEIEEFLTSRSSVRFSNVLGKLRPKHGYSLKFMQSKTRWMLPNIVCIKEQEETDALVEPDDAKEGEFTLYRAAVYMNLVSFEILRDLVPLLVEQIAYLEKMIPCVEACIEIVIPAAKKNLKESLSFSGKLMNASIGHHIAKTTLWTLNIEGLLEDKIRELNCASSMIIYKRVVYELFVYHCDFLIYHFCKGEVVGNSQ